MNGVHLMGKPVAASTDGEFATFSVRISRELANQIEARCKVSKRSKNKEIELMLEKQIEAEVDNNRKIMEEINRRNNQS